MLPSLQFNSQSHYRKLDCDNSPSNADCLLHGLSLAFETCDAGNVGTKDDKILMNGSERWHFEMNLLKAS